MTSYRHTAACDENESMDMAASFSPTGNGQHWLGSRTCFLASTLLLGLLMVLVLPVVYTGTIAIPDEGVYSAQAQALANGSWTQPRPAPGVISPDPTVQARLDPVGPSIVIGDERLPYGRHPLYSVLLGSFFRLMGKPGLLVFSILGGFVAAIFVGLICRHFNQNYGLPGLFLTALSSPLFFNSYIVSAHSWAVAVSSMMIFLILRLLKQWRPRDILLLSFTGFALPLFRSEGFIFASAVAVALLATALIQMLRNRSWAKSGQLAATSVVLGTYGLLGWKFDGAWSESLVGAIGERYTDTTALFSSLDSGWINGLWVALLQPWRNITTINLIVPFTVMLILATVLSSRLLDKRSRIPALLLVSSAATSVALLIFNDQLISGLISAWPLVLFGIIWLKGDNIEGQIRLFFLLALLLNILVMSQLIYDDGGSTQWGGRLFQVMLPILIPLTVIGIVNFLSAIGEDQLKYQRLTVVLLVVISGTFGLSGLRVNGNLRSQTSIYAETISQEIRRVKSDLLSSDSTPRETVVIFNTVPATGNARVFWEKDRDLNLLNIPIELIMKIIRSADLSKYNILVVSDAAPSGLTKIRDAITAQRDLEVVDYGSVVGTPMQVFTVTKG